MFKKGQLIEWVCTERGKPGLLIVKDVYKRTRKDSLTGLPVEETRVAYRWYTYGGDYSDGAIKDHDLHVGSFKSWLNAGEIRIVE